MPLAVFDIDGTLVTGLSTEKRFALHLARRGRIGLRQALAFLAYGARHWPVHGRHILKKNKAYLTGMAEAELAALSDAWASGALAAAWFEPAVARLRRHQQAGDTVVLLSGTPQFVAAAIGRCLGVSDVIGTQCAIRAGRLLAAPAERHPFGAAKLELVREFADGLGADLGSVVAYGDSAHDLPLLCSVGKPVAVCPDTRLARAAELRGWEVLGPVRQGTLSRLVPGLRPFAEGNAIDQR